MGGRVKLLCDGKSTPVRSLPDGKVATLDISLSTEKSTFTKFDGCLPPAASCPRGRESRMFQLFLGNRWRIQVHFSFYSYKCCSKDNI